MADITGKGPLSKERVDLFETPFCEYQNLTLGIKTILEYGSNLHPESGPLELNELCASARYMTELLEEKLSAHYEALSSFAHQIASRSKEASNGKKT